MMRVVAFALAPRHDRPVARPDPHVLDAGRQRHCFDHHGYLSTEEQSGEYVHGWDSHGHRWTTWEHDGRAYTWPTR
jgi:hypothetical protein